MILGDAEGKKNELLMLSKINIIIRFSKKYGTQKCNLYYITDPRGGRLRTEAKPESIL